MAMVHGWRVEPVRHCAAASNAEPAGDADGAATIPPPKAVRPRTLQRQGSGASVLGAFASMAGHALFAIMCSLPWKATAAPSASCMSGMLKPGGEFVAAPLRPSKIELDKAPRASYNTNWSRCGCHAVFGTIVTVDCKQAAGMPQRLGAKALPHTQPPESRFAHANDLLSRAGRRGDGMRRCNHGSS